MLGRGLKELQEKKGNHRSMQERRSQTRTISPFPRSSAQHREIKPPPNKSTEAPANGCGEIISPSHLLGAEPPPFRLAVCSDINYHVITISLHTPAVWLLGRSNRTQA